MKNIITTLLIAFFTVTLLAQQIDDTANRALEREVKTSGGYLYGEAVANIKDEAIQLAKSDLLSEIKKEANNHSTWKYESIHVKNIDFHTDMIELMRGSKFRVIVYIKKSIVADIFDNKTLNNTQEKKNPQSEKDQSILNSNNIQVETLEIMPTTVTVSNQDSEKFNSGVEEAAITSLEAPLTTTDIGNYMNSDSLLDKILNTRTMPEIQKILDSNKRNGKIASGTMNKLIASEKAYLVVYQKTGEIIAILDKGSTTRKDLLSGEIKGKEILENNQVIWFQLF